MFMSRRIIFFTAGFGSIVVVGGKARRIVDASTPTVLDLQVAREFTNWRPSICYALGVEDNLFLDFYWEVRPTFDENVFIETFKKLTNASVAHTNLPACY